MNNEGSRINDLLDEKRNLSNEEASMVDSIIKDLNGNENDSGQTQHKLPQITEEEREELLKQRAYQQQQQQQMRQNHIQQQLQKQQMQQKLQQQQMMDMYSQMNEGNKEPTSMIEYVKAKLIQSVDVVIVLILSIVFNIESFSSFLKFKSVPLLYNIETNESTTLSIFLKGIIIAITYATIKYFIK